MINGLIPNSAKAESDITVDFVTYSGSAFANCKNGDQVFLNLRIVSKMKLKEGDKCRALLLENYDDKKNVTPWRAVRVTAAVDKQG